MILFRADANKDLGCGHIMRCLSIARAFNNRSIDCAFVTADHNPSSLICNRGFQNYCMNSDWKHLEDELPFFESFINKLMPEFIVVDHYYVTKKYLRVLRKFCKIVYIDDLNLSTWPVDAIVNYNIYAESMGYRERYKLLKTKLLLGTQYVPLREEFRSLEEKHIKSRVLEVLISSGGSDPVNLTLKLVQAIKQDRRFSSVRFHIIIGAFNSNKAELEEIASQYENIQLHLSVQRMDLLMQQCDIAISAAGSTLYELCACGVPTITYALADNQIKGAQRFEDAGLMLNAGDCRENNSFTEQILNLLAGLIKNQKQRSVMSHNMWKAVDGKGAERIVDALIASR